MSKEELLFCPLGGSGEIGMNMNLYAYGKEDNQKWIIVDLGVTFADDSIPGIDLIMPDPGFIIDKKDDLLGIVLTHAHEDHIGAVAHIWPDLKCKLYATPFTAALITEKFKEKKIDISSFLKIVPLNSKIKLGDFEIDFVTLTHSILEPNGLSIKTPLGTILHTGDWKIDPNPLIGNKIDEDKLKKIGDEGVSAMICDSTNIFSPGRAGSESDVRDSLLRIMELKTKRILVTSFASNVARMESIFYCAKKTGRAICLVGRSMHRIFKAAKKCGYLKGLIDPIEPRVAKKVAKNKILLVFVSIIRNKLSLTSDSEPALPGLKILVESHIIAVTPPSPIFFNLSSSILFPINGFGSIFQSPVCKIVPRGVLMLNPLGSKIE